MPADVLEFLTPLGERITTDRTIGGDLQRSLEAQTYPAGTFGRFVVDCIAAGVRADTPLDSIEFMVSARGNGSVSVEWNEEAVIIREGSAK